MQSPGRIGAERMVDEECPSAVRQLAVHLHAVMMHLDRIALPVLAPDQPLRPGHREVTRDSRVMGDRVHVRLETDVGRLGLADAVGATGDLCAAVNLVDLHDCSFGMIQCGRGFDVLRVEGPCKPKSAELGGWCAHASLLSLPLMHATT